MKGIYVHIPFCVKKCLYCDFVSTSGGEMQKDYFDALLKEIDEYSDEDMRADSVFFGGGTPSFVCEKYIEAVLAKLREKFDIKENCEITIEANPCSITEEKAKAYKNMGINRISIGLQSGEDRLLKLIGRYHDKNMFLNALDIVKKAGFENINADLIYAIPTQTTEEFLSSLNMVTELNIPHISAYALKIEENTPMYHMEQKGMIKKADEDTDREMYHIARKVLKEKGYKNYEVSNFAKEGYECRHNLKYWDLEDYIGFGVSAHSFCGGKRFENTADISEYINSRKGYINVQEISGEDKEFEYIMLKMRKQDGIKFAEYEKLFEKDFLKCFEGSVKKLQKAGLITLLKDGIMPTEKGFDLQNALVLELVNNM